MPGGPVSVVTLNDARKITAPQLRLSCLVSPCGLAQWASSSRASFINQPLESGSHRSEIPSIGVESNDDETGERTVKRGEQVGGTEPELGCKDSAGSYWILQDEV